jgi:hypothetical protein
MGKAYVFPPLVFRGDGSVDSGLAFVPHVLGTTDDSITLQFRAGQTVTERRESLWTVEEEQVREASGHHAQVGPCAFGPFGFQALAVDAFDVELE